MYEGPAASTYRPSRPAALFDPSTDNDLTRFDAEVASPSSIHEIEYSKYRALRFLRQLRSCIRSSGDGGVEEGQGRPEAGLLRRTAHHTLPERPMPRSTVNVWLDEPSERSEYDHELLLQPETRPIPVKFKGTYAGLDMVEAEYIEIDDKWEDEPGKLLQPETRPISHDQLVIEVKGIYAGLVMVEAKCIDIDEKQSAAVQGKDRLTRGSPRNDQWQVLIALHKQLLHEHHDFFLASQHTSASPALSRLVAKYSMPTSLWRHGIHAFLEVLRHRLLDSLDHMLAFIYIAYNMMALLYETVPSFEDTWIECLGDLVRYRMAIEDNEPKDREIWSHVARFWYNKASDTSPAVGRLHHHLAILARPYSLRQISLNTRALTWVPPLESARGSIMALFDPVLSEKNNASFNRSSIENNFIRAHGLLFTATPPDEVLASKYLFGQDVPITDQIYESGPTTEAASRYLGLGSIPACSIARTDARSKESVLTRNTIMNLGPRVSKFFWCMLQSVSDSRSITGKLTILTICTHFVRPSIARPISNNDGNDHQAPSSVFATPTTAAWPCFVFIATVFLAGHALATIKGPVPVWGSMMTMFAFAWWGTRDDPTTTLWLSATVFIVWTYSAYRYGYATFQKLRIHSSAILIVLPVAILLDVLAAKLTTPMETPTAQSDPLLDLSLPCASLSLTVIVNLIPSLRQQPAGDAQIDMECGFLNGDRTVRFIGLIPDSPPPPPIEADSSWTELPSD